MKKATRLLVHFPIEIVKEKSIDPYDIKNIHKWAENRRQSN